MLLVNQFSILFQSSDPSNMAAGQCCSYECQDGKLVFQGASNKCQIIENLSDYVEVCYTDKYVFFIMSKIYFTFIAQFIRSAKVVILFSFSCNDDFICQGQKNIGDWFFILIGGLILFIIVGVGLCICFFKKMFCFKR